MPRQILLVVKRLMVGQMAANCYLVINRRTGKAIIIDPGDDPEYISDILEREKVKPIGILATHGHFDHLMGAGALQLAYKLPFFINQKDKFLVKNMAESAKHFLGLHHIDPAPQITGDLKAGFRTSQDDEPAAGGVKLRVIETPGHTPGSVCFYSKTDDAVFVGDLLFAGGTLGRTDFSYSDAGDLALSVKKILSLPGKTIVYSGHGEATDIATLKRTGI